MIGWVSRKPFTVLLLTVAVLIAVTLIIAAMIIRATDSPEETTVAVAFLALLGVLITQVVNTVIAWSTAREDQRQKIDSDERQAQTEAFAAYFDFVTQLLTSPDLLRERVPDKQPNPPQSNRNDLTGAVEMEPTNPELLVILRARTLAVLAGEQEPQRKVNVLEFLYEAGLIYKVEEDETAAVSIAGADLSFVDMSESSWERIDLAATRLSDSIFSGSFLRGADLSSSDLSGASFRNADLDSADLSGANLLSADLSGANLHEAVGLTDEQVAAAESLEGATMPDGQKYEDWLKSKVRGKDGEDSSSS